MVNIKRTQFAQAAFDYSTYFAVTFVNTQVGGACMRRPHLVAPDGMSTVGGKMVRQHITLRPMVEGYSVLTVGAVDVAKGVAMLRTFEYLQEAHRARFGNRPFDVDGVSYQAFFVQAQAYFAKQGMRVEIEHQAEMSDAVAKPRLNKSASVIIVILVILVLGLLAVIAGGAFAFMRYYR